jgi:hypothetical protein
VVARTWQDLTALRAGCVVTKSIFLPLKEWETIEDTDKILSIVDVLTTLDGKHWEGGRREADLNIPDFATLEELVEALFLERRRPIVTFHSQRQELIVFKLYKALWPGLRGNFSCCTYALGPRSIGGKPFDLLFSDSDLLIRFSDLDCRRILRTNSPKVQRHRWTNDLTERIFYSEVPSLLPERTTKIFKLEDRESESNLRMGLLWEELLSESESSPFAILGLLDIINSQVVFARELYDDLRPRIELAIKLTTVQLKAMDAWKFFAALLLKHKRKLIDRELLSSIKKECTDLTELDEKAAIEFISIFSPDTDRVPSMLFASIGDGLALNLSDISVWLFEKINDLIGLQLLSTSKDFSRSVMELIASGNELVVAKIIDYLKFPEERNVRRAKSNLIKYIENSSQKDIVRELLRDANIRDYQMIVQCVGENTGFRYGEFDQEILKSTTELLQFDFLLQVLIAQARKNNVNRLLFKLFFLAPQTLRDFYLNFDVPNAMRVEIVEELLSHPPPNLLNIFTKDDFFAKKIVDDFRADKMIETLSLLEIIFSAKLELSVFLNLVKERELDFGGKVSVISFARYIVGISDGIFSTEYSAIASYVSNFDDIKCRQFVEELLAEDLSPRAFYVIVNILFMSGDRILRSMSEQVDIISELIVRKINDVIGDGLINMWCDLVKNARDEDRRQRAAFKMVDFAFRNERLDPTEMLMSSFPIVYNTYLNGKGTNHYFSFIFFNDWDKCKTLRNDLVKRYIQAKWSRFGLFLIAAQLNIVKDTFSILRDSKNGKEFIEDAIDEAKKMRLVSENISIKEFKRYIDSLVKN